MRFKKGPGNRPFLFAIIELIHRPLKVIRGQVGVDHGSLNVGVAHQLLDCGQVDTVHDKVAGEGVTEGMELGESIDTGVFGDFDQPPS